MLKCDVLISIFILTTFKVTKLVEVFRLKAIFVDSCNLGLGQTWITAGYGKNNGRDLTY